jgi:hypothetical protein
MSQAVKEAIVSQLATLGALVTSGQLADAYIMSTQITGQIRDAEMDQSRKVKSAVEDLYRLSQGG